MMFFPRRLKFMLALFSLLLLAGCKVELYSNLTEQEANQVIATLINAGISVEKSSSRDGITVTVEESSFAEAVDILDKLGLPAHKFKSIGDVFQKSGIVSSPTEERARYIYALNQELGNTVSEIDGVLSARVHVVLPESDILGRQFKPSSASVFVRHVDGVPVEKFTPHIKMLVANSIEGLVYDKVSVVTIPALDLSVTSVDDQIMETVTSVNYVVLISRLLLVVLLLSSLSMMIPDVRKRVIGLINRPPKDEGA